MVSLNLPPFEYKIRKAEGKLWIFDVIRKKYIVLVPEEWVRQHFVNYLLTNGYPRSLIRIEGGLQYSQRLKRSDIVVYSRDGAPWMIVECKAPDIKLSENSVFQASVYNATLRARYLAVSNGLTRLYAEIDWEKGTAVQLPGL